MVLTKPGVLSQHDVVMTKAYFLKKEEGGKSKPHVSTLLSKIFSLTFDAYAQMHFDRDMVLPGEDVNMKLMVRLKSNIFFIKLSLNVIFSLPKKW